MSRKNKNKHRGEEAAEAERVIRPGDDGFETDEAKPAEGAEAGKAGGGDEAEALRNQLLRVSADYQNYQKRTARQIEQAGQLAQESLAKSLLPMLDNFEHTLAKGKEFADIAAVLDGVRIVYDHLQAILTGQGIERIGVSAGDEFDPSRHEAMLHEESSELAENTVVRELAAGYMMNGRTLRPAKVSVAKRREE